MANNNSVMLIGRLTRDPELQYTSSNNPFVRFNLAVNRTYADQDGNKNADFIQCVAYGKRAENLARYQQKGSLVSVEGRIETSQSQDKTGKMNYYTNVIADDIGYLESRGQQQNNNDFNFNPNQNYNGNNNRRQNNNFNQQMQDNNRFQDFGQDFPSNFDDDFLNDVVNPFKK